MRIWDIHPGYLNRGSLLGEHRELHALASICLYGKRGYAHHPETRRWRECLGALAIRHDLLVAEMRLRGYGHASPLPIAPDPHRWPDFLDPPARQLDLLRQKYAHRELGRIPLPRNAQELWAQHKYSVLARDPTAYRILGRRVARMHSPSALRDLVDELVGWLRRPPSPGGLRNAVEHMWGHVAGAATPEERRQAQSDIRMMLGLTQRLAYLQGDSYLLHATALSEIEAWLSIIEEQCP